MINNAETLRESYEIAGFTCGDETYQANGTGTSGGIVNIFLMKDGNYRGSVRWEMGIGWHGVGGDRKWRETVFLPILKGQI